MQVAKCCHFLRLLSVYSPCFWCPKQRLNDQNNFVFAMHNVRWLTLTKHRTSMTQAWPKHVSKQYVLSVKLKLSVPINKTKKKKKKNDGNRTCGLPIASFFSVVARENHLFYSNVNSEHHPLNSFLLFGTKIYIKSIRYKVSFIDWVVNCYVKYYSCSDVVFFCSRWFYV